MKVHYLLEAPDDGLAGALQAIAEDYPLSGEGGDVRVTFRPAADAGRVARVRPGADGFVIDYANRACALRALGTVLARGQACAEADVCTDFETFGIMLDCSRNAVMQVSALKGWLRRLALLGYNMAMLYTEDTYRLESEPYFGYQRGAYTADELREIDAYAQRLGIELIACVQTLGHMAQILKWPAYDTVRDTNTVLLADEPETYELIEKIIRHWSEVLATRRIHVGMDETHDLGRGVYMDRFGHRDGFAIFNEHLDRVVKLCEKHGLSPMIWSDMYFRLGSKTGDYYDKDATVPEEARAQIPKDVQLVYWDYYHNDESFYLDWIERHRALGFEPIMGSGVWTWGSVWHATNYTETKGGACVRACRQAGLKEIFFTMWGDDGSMCDFDSAMAGLTYVAELAYESQVDDAAASARFGAVCGGDYAAARLAGELSFLEKSGIPDGDEDLGFRAWAVLWDDPLLGIYWNDKQAQNAKAWADALSHYRRIAEGLAGHADAAVDVRGGDLRHAALMANVLAEKVSLRVKLTDAYARRDADALRQVAAGTARVIELLEALDASYRRQWLRRNKPFGLEIVQVRIAGLIRRYRELADRVTELVEGQIDRIAELDDVPSQPASVRPSYGRVTTACDNFA